MTKKLIVPERFAGQKNINPTPPSISKAFDNKEDANPNSKDPSDRLPNPTGYRMLVIPYYVPEKVNGIIIPDKTRDRESFASVVAYVVKIGPDAYKDKDKFPSGAWCSEKDWVLMGRYAGNKFKVDGLELRIINDDNIIASILDPKDISYI